MRAPLIGIVCGPYREGERLIVGLRPTYIRSVTGAGGLPVLIPHDLGLEALRGIYERVDGILLPGGGDIDPIYYGMTADGMAQEIEPGRDLTEISLARWARADDKPLLGICRGCQVVNVALGGTLYRDIPTEYPGDVGLDHALWGKFPRDHEGHTVALTPGSRLAQALGADGDSDGARVPVNSLHHQAVRDIPTPLVATAWAEDGVVEGVEIPDARFFIGVQWHPEELIVRSEAMRRLFRTFVVSSATSG